MTLLLGSLIDGAIVLGIGLAATALLRRRSAALRHAILATAIVTASVMPIFELLLPQFPVVRWYDTVSVVSSGLTLGEGEAISGSTAELATREPGVPWATVLLLVWMLGAAVACAALVTGLARLAVLRARSTPVSGRWRQLADELSPQCGVNARVALLQSSDPTLLVTCGVLKPRIILPAGASSWTTARARIVLRHELAHIRRHDTAVQLAGEALRVVQWMNPLTWLACRRLRQESEYACDDEVLRGGVEGTEYATHLLDLAKHLTRRHRAWASAPAIAHPSTLERRIGAMLYRQRNRAPIGRRGWALAALAALVIGVPLAAAGVAPAERAAVMPSNALDVVLPGGAPAMDSNAAPRAAVSVRVPAASRTSVPPARATAAVAQETATVAGTLLDQSGGTLPGVSVTLTDTQTDAKVMAVTDASGRFGFRDVRPGPYQLAAGLPGFKTVKLVLMVTAGSAARHTITLQIGEIQETVKVVCQAGPGVARLRDFISRPLASVFPVLSAQEPAGGPVRVGGNIRPPRKLTDVKPVCPPSVPPGETTVRITGQVGVDGFTTNLSPLPSEAGPEPPRELIDSALDAVRRWTFTPTLLNGQPVEITMKVNVVFRKQ